VELRRVVAKEMLRNERVVSGLPNVEETCFAGPQRSNPQPSAWSIGLPK
jgi:hypothetical protein